MGKRVVIVLFFFSIFSSILVSIIRWRVETNNDCVELACDYNEISQLCLQSENEIGSFLFMLRDAGISSIAIEEDTLERLFSEGRISLMKGEEVKKLQFLSPTRPIFVENLGKGHIEKYTFVLTIDSNLGKKIEKILVEKLEKEKIKKIECNLYGKPLTMLSLYGMDEGEISQIGIGFSREKLEKICNYGLKAILLLTNRAPISEASIEALFSTVPGWGNISLVTFSGDSILGYPDFLDSVRRRLRRDGVKLGIVEFLNQEGLEEVTKNLYEKIVRVHSDPPDEAGATKGAGRLDISRLIARYKRAVRERNVRLLYIHLPLVSGNVESMKVQSAVDSIRKIKLALLGDNFKVGLSQPFNAFPAWLQLFRLPIFLIILVLPLCLVFLHKSISLGINPFMKAFSLGGNERNGLSLTNIGPGDSPELSTRVLYLFLFGSMALTLFFWQETLFLQIVTLIAALSFPILALVFGLGLSQSQATGGHRQGNLSRAVWLFLKVTFTTILGGIMIASLFTRLDFMLKVHQFRGVKASFILPLVMGLFLLMGWEEQSLARNGLIRLYSGKVSEFLTRKVEFRHLIIFSILALGGIGLLFRSGNYPGPFLLEMENRLREFLERLLLVRPRIKEFIIGHPFMVVGMYIYLEAKLSKERSLRIEPGKWQLFTVLGLIGQVSIINSFCHAHTPLVISLARTIHGIWLGTIMGVLLVTIIQWKTRRTLGVRR